MTKLRKAFVSLICLLTVITCNIFSTTPQTIKAASGDGNIAYVTLTDQLEQINVPYLGLGNSYKIEIGNGTNRNVGFCLNYYAVTSTGYLYNRNDNMVNNLNVNIIKAFNFYLNSSNKESDYQVAQTIMWGFQHGILTSLDPTNQDTQDYLDDVMTQVDSGWTTYKRNLNKMLQLNGISGSAEEYLLRQINNSSTNRSGIYYYYKDSASQPILTANSGIPPYERPLITTVTESATANENVKVQINKTDDVSGKGIDNVSFDFYRDNVKIAENIKTNTNGIAETTYSQSYSANSNEDGAVYRYCKNWNKISADDKVLLTSQGVYTNETDARNAAKAHAQTLANTKANQNHTYKAVETETKTAYWLDANGNTVSADKAGSGTVTLSLTNQAQLGSIELTKLDDQTLQGLTGFGFDLYARENILDPADGSILFAAGTKVASFPLTDANGKTRLDGLHLGAYFWKEASVNTGYLIDPTEHNVTLSYKGSNYQFTDTATATHQNTAVRGSTILFKQDADTHTSVPQGNATIEGAVYGLYAKNNITHPDGHTGIITYDQITGSNNQIRLTAGTDLQVTGNRAVAGALLATIKTDANGKFGVENLYLGDYYWKELTPSQGYLKDPVQHDFTLSYAGQNVPVVTSSTTSYEQVMKQAFDIFKAGHVPGTSMNSTPLAGAEFTVWLESDIQTLINQGHTLEEAKELATVYDVLITATDGTASSIELPFGYYRVAETVTPRGHITANDFFITVDHDDRTHQSWTNNVIVNEMFTSYLKIVKKNSESNKTVLVPGAEYKIKALTEAYVDGRKFNAGEYIGYFTWNPFQGFWVDSWKTDATGSVMLNEKLSFGKYQLEEITAPEGHILNTTPIEFEIVQSDMVEQLPNGSSVITIEQKDEPVKGQIEILKKGEELTGIRQNEDGSYSFIYEEKPQGETVFEIAAAEDILDPADHSVIYAAGTLIETVTTDADGKVVSSLMPLGKYKVTEKTVKDGMVLNTEVKTITLEYQDENTPIVKEVVEFINDRQKVKIEAFKQDIDTQERLSGAEITLTLVSDLLDANGNVILPAGKIIEKQVTDENGEAHFEVDLPVNAQFILSETKEPIGYLPTDTTYRIDTTWQGQDVEVQSYTFTFENKITEVEIIKTDASTGQYLPNVILGVYPVNDEGEVLEGECFATFKTENEPTILKGLEQGKYVLRELSTVYGFVKLTEDIPFEVTTDPVTVHVSVENEIETGKLVWNKTGKIFLQKEISESDYGKVETPVFEMSNILGAEITIYAAEDITLGNGKTYYSKDEAIQVLESDWDPVESQDLYPGKYYYVETKTPHGMVPDTEKHFFEIEWNGTVEVEKVESTLVNVRPDYQIDFTKTLEENDVPDHEAYRNVLFGIYAREDIYDYMGHVAIEAGTLIAVCGIDEEGHLVNVPELPVGQFYLKELSTDVAYVLDETEYDFTIKQSSEKAVMIPVNDSKPVENILKRTTIHFNKVDAQTGEAVISKDFVFTRYADPECKQKIESVHANTEDGYAEFNIAYGTWYIKESEAPLGYKISDEVVKVTFNEDGLFINGQKVEAESEGIYSYRYVNTLLPSSVITSDSQNMIMWQLTLLVSALLLVLFMMSKKIENMNA